MVFSSVLSSFLDPPLNWSQSVNNHNLQLQESGSLVSTHQVLSHHFPQNPNPNHHHVATAAVSAVDPANLNVSAVDPANLSVSAAERARLIKNSPEGALKCPRCDSANTKFCYFNNYNLTQPRHFCKACRRYWTRGGALRNVPVGGGCRKNKKRKTGNSKSSSSKQSTSMVNAPNPTTTSNIQLQATTQFPFLPTLQNLTQFGSLGLNLSAINGGNPSSSCLNDLGFFHGNNNNPLGSTSQFDLFDRNMRLCAFLNEDNMRLSSSSASMGTSRVSETPPVKREEALIGNIIRPVSGLTQYWTGLDIHGSSSNDHHLT